MWMKNISNNQLRPLLKIKPNRFRSILQLSNCIVTSFQSRDRQEQLISEEQELESKIWLWTQEPAKIEIIKNNLSQIRLQESVTKTKFDSNFKVAQIEYQPSKSNFDFYTSYTPKIKRCKIRIWFVWISTGFDLGLKNCEH